ncbi:NAD-dependent epimerase/dehydratase family protein [Chromobacterium sp. ASV23]|uniref:NAD-dependent epimerase/dehydratase family protein n=1 Tax=Chromobacterium sp. ASV23 TaxID=2795110 RepID=UPI0018ED932D
MKVLITGGVGFVGGHLARSLASEGHDVTLLDNFKRGVHDPFIESCINELGVKVLKADLLEESTLQDLPTDFTHVYHLAAIIGVTHVLQRPYEVLADNTKMTDNVIGLCRRQEKLQRLLFSSTSEVYAGSLIHMDMPIPTPETTPIALTGLDQPRTSYMLSKLYGEAMCNMSGLPVTNVRLHNVYGPRMGMSHVIPELLFKAWKSQDGDTLDVFSVDHCRTFCFVSDAVRMIRALAESDSALGQTVNIGNESPEISIGELAEVVVSTVGRKLNLVPQPATPGSPSRRCPKTGLLKDLTGVSGMVSLQEGVRQTFDWYLANVFQGGVSAK